MTRSITYCQAIQEATAQEMRVDPTVFTYGIGAPDHKKIFGTTEGLVEEFGEKRCFDTPLCEDALMGFGIGAALNGLRPINMHIRVDFLLLALNQLINMASNYCYITDGKLSVPLVIRAIIGRGWGQGSQHSKSLYSLFAHIPGLKVAVPTTPKDAKGIMIAAIRDNNPVVILEHRWLYWQTGEVPEESYEIPLEGGQVLREGSDLTLVCIGWACVEGNHVSQILQKHGINIEIIDPRTISPLDDTAIINSVLKTGKCLIVEDDWAFCGFGAEIAARVSNKCFSILKKPVERIGCVHSPCPTARHMESEFYPNAINIIKSIENMLEIKNVNLDNEVFYAHENRFKGPF